jgi:tetratricopeptide (TPR) repeat protein
LRNWETLSSDNVWKKRLRNLSGNVSNLCIENGDDAVAYSLLARWLYDRKLMKKAVDIRQQVPVLKCSGEAALPTLGVKMKMPELCYQVPYDMLPVYLAAAGDIDGAERALANVPEAARNDLRMIVMLHKKNYVGIRQILKNEKAFPRTSMAFQAACVAAIKLKDTALLEQIISGLPAVSAEKLPPDICNIVGYSGAELSYKLSESEKFVAAALKSDPTSFSYLDSMAWVLFKQGKYSEARKYIGQAVKYRDADPNVAVVFLHAAGIEFAATGDKAASRSYLERAEKLVTAEICDYDSEYAAKLKELLK